MKLQDIIPLIDPMTGVPMKFYQPDVDTYYINSPYIMTQVHLIDINQSYVFLHAYKDELMLHYVKITKAYYDGYVMNVHMIDKETKKEWHLEFKLCGTQRCSWLLIDPIMLQEDMEQVDVTDYCKSK